MRSRLFHGASAVAVALTFAAWGNGAAADTATDTNNETQVREVEVVASTGSYIQRETTALPVDVMSNQDLEAQGAPTTVDLVKTITASASGLGESNRYNGGAGTASINLRGFGASRTLSLMNGRRLPDSTAAAFQGGGANLNAIPNAAIGRVEILKDGAAATYGSEAIGGVVNFITRTDLDGFEAQGQYRYIDGSDGDYEASVAWGTRFDQGNILLTAGYRHRSRLDIHERDWAILPFYTSAAGGFSSNSNPGNYHFNQVNTLQSAANFMFRDNGCTELGGTLTVARVLPNTTLGGVTPAPVAVPVNPNNLPSNATTTSCQFQFSNFNDLVNEEDHYQLYGEVNYDLSDRIRFHGEASFAIDDVPNQRISPANGNTQFPTPFGQNCMRDEDAITTNANTCTGITAAVPPNGPTATPRAPGGGLSGSLARTNPPNFFVPYNVPFNNPGLQDLRLLCGGGVGVGEITVAQCASITAASAVNGPGVDISQTAFRFLANAGSPRGTDGADRQTVNIQTYRVSGGFAGDFNDSLHWDTNILYAQARGEVETADLLVDRVQLALNGFGSLESDPGSCSAADRANPANAGNNAVGCYFFNPFSSAIPVSAVNGQANPYYRGNVNSALNNNQDMILWLYGPYTSTTTNSLFVADAVVSGDTPLSLWGGQVQFALGAQYRWNRDQFDVEGFQDIDTYPCVDSVDDGTPACGAPNGPTIFFGGQSDDNTTRTVWALFGEARLPVTETFEVSLAGRYESFSNGIGDTFNPKVSVRWQLNDVIALRGSAGTTFRAPTAAQVSPNCATGVANLSGQYRAVRTCGNPTLEPETADAYNIGLIAQHGGLNVTLDYWIINFEGELTTEGASNLVAAMFPTVASNGNSATTHTCGTIPALEARFSFTTGACGTAGLTTVLASDILRVDTFAVNGPDTTASGLDFRGSYDWSWDDSWYQGRYQVGVEATYLFEYARGAFRLFTDPNVTFAQPFDRAGTYDLISAFFSYPKLKSNLWLNYNRGRFNARWQVQYTQGVEPAVNTLNTIVVPDGNAATFGYHAERLFRSDDYWQHNLILRYEFSDMVQATFNIQNIFDQDPPFAISNYNYDYTNGNPLGRTFEIGIKARF